MKFNFYDREDILDFVSKREGEIKFGEEVALVQSFEEIKDKNAEFVIFGIPEDIGVRANYGKPGTSTAWNSFLTAFLNIQKNGFNSPQNTILLGEIDCGELMNKAASLNLEDEKNLPKLGLLVSELDVYVAEIVEQIHSGGKTPIIIGGGHNNAYGNIRGLSKSLGKPVNVLNIDAHTDLRNTDYRHSGNGFSYAKKEGFLKKYAVFGLHINYTPEYIFEMQNNSDEYLFDLYENMISLSRTEKTQRFQRSMYFLEASFGLEIDCDAIEKMQSSAMTPSGFLLDDIRAFLQIAKKETPFYLHLCEASAQQSPMTGKALSYLVSDFIRKS